MSRHSSSHPGSGNPEIKCLPQLPDFSGADVLSRVLTVKNKLGVHARPAAMIVSISNHYEETELFVTKEDEKDVINGKSIMGLMMLAAGPGTKLHFFAIGPGREALLDELETIFQEKFREA